MKIPSKQEVDERIRASKVFVVVPCPVCGDKFEIDHSRTFLPCKNTIRCVCKTEYAVEISLELDTQKPVAKVSDIDMSKTVKSAFKKRAAS